MIRELWSNNWLAIKEIVEPDKGVKGYSFLHEKRCGGKIVVLMPYRIDKNNEAWYLLRKEVTPCWGMDQVVSSITGGVEKDDVIETAIHELKEEAGYECTAQELIPLGTTFGTKSTDTVYSIFAIDVSRKQQGEATGDGSKLEAMAECAWGKDLDVARSKDPQVAMAWLRLQYHLGRLPAGYTGLL